MDHVTYILFATGIRMDEYHPCIYIYIYIYFLGWGQEITGKTLYFLFPTVNIA